MLQSEVILAIIVATKTQRHKWHAAFVKLGVLVLRGWKDKYQTVRMNQGTVIKADKLTKQFGDFTAVDNISFEVRQGRNIWFPWCKWSR
jgi:hypothetical protein